MQDSFMMASKSSLDRLVAVLTSIVHEVLGSVKLPTIQVDNDKLFLEELKQIRRDNATFQRQIVVELGELRRTIAGGFDAFESRNASTHIREIAL